MARYAAYRLAFRSPLHIGERGVGLEETRVHVPADTLFSAMCSVWRTLHGTDALLREVLQRFPGTSPEAVRGQEPFFLGSAFPCAGSVRLFPRPLAGLPPESVNADDEKVFKRVRFLSESLFRSLCQGEPKQFRTEELVNGRSVWISQQERSALPDLADDTTGDLLLWKVAVVPRVTLDRVMLTSQIWHFGELHLAAGCGLWFPVWFNPVYGAEWRRRFEGCLRLLGDAGLGGERGAGRGLFDWTADELELPEPVPGNRFVTLAPVCPGTEDELTRLTGNGAAYELLPRRGWIGSPDGTNLRRKMIWMLGEGSVLTGASDSRPGRLADLTPQLWENQPAGSHRVWRYGYAFPVRWAVADRI